MSYQIILNGVPQTFKDIDDAAERARRISLEFGGVLVKVFDAESGQIAFTVKSTRKKD